uniref:Protein SRG1-like n=1 Tax=Nelumbo nucifera TaxID=4432 RepID=A0A822ZXM9_NELNU|nr:TPA_asm: hypothetical protein HUJ06_018052 [Nelumbo nucifera]
MEAQPPVLGSSLLVPSVQELAKEPMITVPSRYIRSGQYPPIIPISNSSSVPTVPVINMLNLIFGESMDSELAKLDTACRDWGFFERIKQIQSFSSLKEKRR